MSVEGKHTPLPCPFCGGEASFLTTFIDDDSQGWIACGECRAAPYGTRYKEQAVAAWNTRVVNSHHALVEALRGLSSVVEVARRTGYRSPLDVQNLADANERALSALASATQSVGEG